MSFATTVAGKTIILAISDKLIRVKKSHKPDKYCFFQQKIIFISSNEQIVRDIIS